MSDRKAVMIVGSGMMGSGIAAVSALAGNPTILADCDGGRARAGVQNAVGRMEELAGYELITPQQKEAAEQLVTWTEDIASSAGETGLVIEAITENLSAKQELFAQLDALLPEEVPIASNTSGLRITDIATRTKHPERTMTTHFWFPAHLVPLVEVVMSEYTDETMAVAMKQRLKEWGKAPVLVRRDLPGQLANRILQAVIREASNIVEIGLATPEDVDTAVKMGMGIRFPAWGPLEHVDAVGVDLCTSVQNTVLPNLSDAKQANRTMTEMAEQNQLGYKTGKGFYDWSVKDMEQLQRERDAFIVHALKTLRRT